MKKLNTVLYNKLILQAEEAKHQGMTKLASDVFVAIGCSSDDENYEYSKEDLLEDVKTDLWKSATNILKYYDVDSVNVEKLEDSISSMAEQLVDQMNVVLGFSQEQVGPNEPLLIGEQK